MTTAEQVAQWMAEELERCGELYQEDAAYEIWRKFGDEFIHNNENGNLAIAREVLKEFRKLNEEDVVWERGERLWRKRRRGDQPGRRQDNW